MEFLVANIILLSNVQSGLVLASEPMNEQVLVIQGTQASVLLPDVSCLFQSLQAGDEVDQPRNTARA
jgi:hypothetical protein